MPDEFSVRYWEDADLGRLPVDERDRQSVPIVVPGHHPVGIEKPVKRRYVESPQVAVCRIDDRRYVVEVTRNAVPVRTPGRGPDGTLPFDRTTNRSPSASHRWRFPASVVTANRSASGCHEKSVTWPSSGRYRLLVQLLSVRRAISSAFPSSS